MVAPDAPVVLKSPLDAVLLGASRYRCRVSVLRNVLAQFPKRKADVATGAILTIFAQSDPDHVRKQFKVMATVLGGKHRKSK